MKHSSISNRRLTELGYNRVIFVAQFSNLRESPVAEKLINSIRSRYENIRDLFDPDYAHELVTWLNAELCRLTFKEETYTTSEKGDDTKELKDLKLIASEITQARELLAKQCMLKFPEKAPAPKKKEPRSIKIVNGTVIDSVHQ